MILKLKELLFNNVGTRQTVAKNIFWLTVGQIGTRLLRALVIIYAARALGASEYGVFSYVLGLAGFFTIFSDIGINTILTKEAAANPEESRHYFATSFWLKIALLVFTIILVMFVAPYFSNIEAAKPLLIFAAMLAVFDGIREFSAAFFRAREKMELETLITTVTNVAITIFGFLILSMEPTSRALAMTYALSAGTGTLLGIFILRREFGRVFSDFKRELLKPIIQLAWPIALVSLVGVFMLNMDIIMLGMFKAAEDVGFYSASQRIIQLLYTLPSILAISFYPVLAKFVGQKEKEKVKEVMERGITTSLLLAVPIVIGGVILGADIIKLLYGDAYLAAVPSFRVLLFTALLIFPGYHISNYIMVHNEQRRVVLIILASSLGNIVFNAILIPFYGALGAAIATLGALSLNHGLSWRLAKKINNFFTLPHLKNIVLASVLMGLAALLMHWLSVFVIINIIVSAGLYFAALFFLKEISVLEVKNLFGNKRT
jgi:O-antigen/teichoic acid export membrane protein